MKIRKPEIFFSFLCLSIGLGWIFISSIIIENQKYSVEQLERLDTYTDSLFVVVVSIILYLSIHFYRKRFINIESRYKVIFNTSPLPMWIFNADTGKFLLVNNAMMNKYGYSRDELINMSPVDIRPGEDKTKFLKYINTSQEGILDAGVWTHKKKNGELFTAQIRTAKIQYQEKDCFLVVADDITDVIKKEEEIKRLSLVAKHTVNGIIITSNDRKIEWVNDSFIKMTGYSFKEAVGKLPTDLLHREQTSKDVEVEMATAISKGLNFSGEILNFKKDGSKMWVQTTVSPVEVDGKIDKYVTIFLDITERKNQEQLIRQQNKRLREIAFASSHLIRAPLANILGLTNLIQEDANVFDPEIITHLKHSAKKLDEAITEMVRQSANSSNGDIS